jgi:hypothetical protein
VEQSECSSPLDQHLSGLAIVVTLFGLYLAGDRLQDFL